MKIIRIINGVVVILPFVLALIGIIENSFLCFALLSTMLTGFVQVVLGIIMLSKKFSDKHLKQYIIMVFSFFAIWILNAQMNYVDIINYCLIPIPLILATYLTVIIHKKNTL